MKNLRLVTFVSCLALLCICYPVQAENSIDLDGNWQFRIDRKDEGINDKWFDKTFDETIKLPGSMTQRGFGDDITADTEWVDMFLYDSGVTHELLKKYRQLSKVKVPFWLTPTRYYVGPAWYQRTVNIPQNFSGKRIVLTLERTHWDAQVWVNGIESDMQNSLGTPNRFDVSEQIIAGKKNRISIRIDNRLKIPIGSWSHSVTDHTQTNWNGIVGQISLYATDKVWLDDVQIYPDVKNKLAKVKVKFGNRSKDKAAGKIKIKAKCGWTNIAAKNISFNNISDGDVIEIDYPMGENVKLWDEFNHSLYTLTIEAAGKSGKESFKHSHRIKFGMREISKQGTQLTINGKALFLRGTLECNVFPLTGYPPTDVQSWKRIIRICKAHGLNHIRFHSNCPPKAAFTAADELGFYFHAEAGSWTEVGNDESLNKWLYAEGRRMITVYGNHPSFIMMAYGNEPYGNTSWLTDYVLHFKKLDPRRLYTTGAGGPAIPQNDYHNIPEPRIQWWQAGLASRINAKAPETVTDYRKWVNENSVPIVSHEAGQWCVYPNFKEIKKYTGVTRAYNLNCSGRILKTKTCLTRPRISSWHRAICRYCVTRKRSNQPCAARVLAVFNCWIFMIFPAREQHW